MSRVIKKVGDEVALLTPNGGDRVINTHGEEVFEAAFIFVGNLDNSVTITALISVSAPPKIASTL
jgi:hypothetical protein